MDITIKMKDMLDLRMESWVSTFLIASGVALVFVYIQTLLWKRRFQDKQGGADKKPVPPGAMGWPFVGETLQFLHKGPAIFSEKNKRYGSIYKTHLFGSPTIRVSGAEILRQLSSKEPKALDVMWPKSNRDLMGHDSLPVVKGEQHMRLRKIIQDVFTSTRISDYVPCIQEHIRNNLMSWTGQGKLLGFTACEHLVADVMTEVLLGLRKENDIGRKVRSAALTINSNLFVLPINLPGFGYRKAMNARKVVVDFVRSRLDGGRDKDHVCMMDVFLSHHGTAMGMSEKELMDNAVSLFIASMGTTSSALCLCLLRLGRNRDLIENIRKELDELGLLGKGSEEHLSLEVLQQLNYVQAVEKELLRLQLPVGGAYRKLTIDLETEDYRLPKDWNLIYSYRGTHEVTDVFEDKELFKPERWLDPELQRKLRQEGTGNYVAFGVGPRICIGKQLARTIIHVFLVECARLVEWQLHNPEVVIMARPSLVPRDLLPVTFTRRQ